MNVHDLFPEVAALSKGFFYLLHCQEGEFLSDGPIEFGVWSIVGRSLQDALHDNPKDTVGLFVESKHIQSSLEQSDVSSLGPEYPVEDCLGGAPHHLLELTYVSRKLSQVEVECLEVNLFALVNSCALH